MKREMIILVAAVLLGVAAILLNQLWARRVEDALRAELRDQVEVVAIKKRVEAQAVLEKDVLVKKEIPKTFAHPQAVPWTDRASVESRRVRHPMQADQPLLWSDLVGSSRRSIGDAILPGWGVVTIPIDLVGGVSGLITPGSRVDLYGIFRELPGFEIQTTLPEVKESAAQSSGELRELMGIIDQLQTRATEVRDRFYVQFIANNLGVFAVGTRTQMDVGSEETGGAYSTISFAVPHGMQVALIMASQKAEREGGKLVCVLRSNEGAEDALDEAKPYISDDFMTIVRDAARFEAKK